MTRQVADAREGADALRRRIEAADGRLGGLRLERTRLEQRAQQLAVEQERAGGQLEELAADRESAGSPVADVADAERKLAALARETEALGTIRPGSLAAYQTLEERAHFLEAEQSDVERAARDLEATLGDLAGEVEGRRRQALQQLEAAFATAVTEMFGGGRGGFQWVSTPEPGIELWVEPPGKRPQSLGLLSGGENALGALAWLFALLDVRPAPLVVLDEAEASLDEENARRFALYLARRRHSQYVVVTHHKSTMEQAAALWGFATDGGGASRLVSVRLGTSNPPAEVG
jgi:chromosome segregation protein